MLALLVHIIVCVLLAKPDFNIISDLPFNIELQTVHLAYYSPAAAAAAD